MYNNKRRNHYKKAYCFIVKRSINDLFGYKKTVYRALWQFGTFDTFEDAEKVVYECILLKEKNPRRPKRIFATPENAADWRSL